MASGFSLVVVSRGYSPDPAVSRLLIAMVSLVVEHGLEAQASVLVARGLSSCMSVGCKAQAQ